MARDGGGSHTQYYWRLEPQFQSKAGSDTAKHPNCMPQENDLVDEAKLIFLLHVLNFTLLTETLCFPFAFTFVS